MNEITNNTANQTPIEIALGMKRDIPQPEHCMSS